jgi:WD40 repeat protein
VWDAQKGTEVLSLEGHTSTVFSVCFSPDGKRILTGSQDNTAKVWDADKGTEVLALEGHTNYVSGVCFSPDGRRILTGSLDNTAKVWDAQNGTEVLALKGHTNWVRSVCFSPDGKRILTGSLDNTAKVWDAGKGAEILRLEGHKGVVSSVAFSADGRRLFAWDAQGKALAWSVADGKPLEPRDPPQKPRPGPAHSPDGHLVAEADGLVVSVTDVFKTAPKSDPFPDAAQRKRYHTEQAALAEKHKQHFALAFHLGRLLLDDPDNAGLKKRRDDALKRHADR